MDDKLAMMLKYLIIFLLAATSAVAQPQPPTPSQTAIQLNQVINSWAQAIEALQQQNQQLRAEIEDLKKKLPPEQK